MVSEGQGEGIETLPFPSDRGVWGCEAPIKEGVGAPLPRKKLVIKIVEKIESRSLSQVQKPGMKFGVFRPFLDGLDLPMLISVDLPVVGRFMVTFLPKNIAILTIFEFIV